MPVVSPYTTHPVVMGFGTLSIMGSTPAALVGVTGNNAHWMTATKIAYQDYTTAPAVLKSYDTGTLMVAALDGAGANTLGAGGNVWSAFLAGVGVRTMGATFGPLPNAGIADVSHNPTLVSELGQTVVITDYANASGVTVYSSTGTVQATIPAVLTSSALRIRQNIVAYQDAAGWHLYDVSLSGNVSGFLPRPNIIRLVPFTIGSQVGVLEYEAGTNILSVRLATQLTGLIIPTVGTEFNPDVQGVDSTHVRVAWSLTQGEAPADLVILDIDTSDGTTQKGVVVAGSVSFSAGPTLDGATFSGSTAGGNTLPYQSQQVLLPNGEMTKVWRDALQRISGAVQAVTTMVNNLPTPVSSPSFGTIGTVVAPSPSSVLAFTSSDASVTITPNQGGQSIDFVSVSSGAGVPYYVPVATTFTVPLYIQGLWTIPIVVDGTLVVDGYLVEVD